MRRLLPPLVAAFCVLSAVPASAQERELPDLCATRPAAEAEQQGGFVEDLNRALAEVDAKFGEWVVGPMASVLFWDVVFWDDDEEAIVGRAVEQGLSREQAEQMLAAAGEPRTPLCLEFGLTEARCADVLGAHSTPQLVARACAAGLTSDQVRRLRDAPSDPRVAYAVAQGLTAGQARDILSGLTLPFIVLWLVAGATFFTFRFGFISLRAFKHAILVTRGAYDDPNDPGEVNHFQALSSALSATVGLGNIAGVAVAIGLGGPGATFWMIVAGFLGMTSKFTECTLGQLYRQVDAAGKVSGGPMRYLSKGLAEMKLKPLGLILAYMFAVMCVGGSLGGGNMFQANQSAAQVGEIIGFFKTDAGRLVYGLLLAGLVGLVIIGGIRRIGAVAGFIVPIMCAVYVVSGLAILVMNVENIGWAFSHIVSEAFTPEAGLGGLAGVLVVGFQRAAFSNEAGIGSASIAHSAAATDEPVREGIVALLEPFIDTIVVCTMTALVVVITGAYRDPEAGEGIVMTSWAFGQQLTWFPQVLSFAAFLFAFSTMISWSYYGERCWSFIFGSSRNVSMIYRVVFLVFVVLGSILELGNVIGFSDLMILGMAFPNILGLLLLSNRVSRALDDYWGRLKRGEMPPGREHG